MNVEGRISMSAPVAPSFGGGIDMGPVMGGPSFSIVNEGPAPMASLGRFGELSVGPSINHLGGTVGPIEALNATFPMTTPNIEPQPFNIFNEGPVPVSFLENNRPFVPEDYARKASPFEANTDNQFRSIYSDPGSVYEQPQNLLVIQPMPMFEPAPRTSVFEPRPLEFGIPGIVELVMPKIGIAEPLIKPEEDEETEAQLEVVRGTINSLKQDLKTATRNFEAVSVESQPQLQTETKKIILQLVEKKEEKRNTSSKEKQGIEISRNILVKDEKALARRLQDAVMAVKMAFENATRIGRKSVKGKEVKQLIPNEYSGVRSGVLIQDKKDDLPDGSYKFEEVGIDQIEETSSEEQMQSRVKQTVNNNIPVIRSENEGGEPVTTDDVEKVYLFRKSPPIEQVVVKEQKEVKPFLKEVFKVAA